MGEGTRYHQLLGRLRENPPIYRAARGLYRIAAAVPREILRMAGPASSRFGAPKGTFSAFDRLNAGQLAGRTLYRQQETPLVGRSSMISTCGLAQDRQQPWPAFWTRMGETRLVGPALLPVDGDKRACVEAMYRAGGGFERNSSYNYLAIPPPKRLAGSWTSLVSVLSGSFYHWFHDELPRLWPLPELPADTGILIPPKPAAYVRETLRWLGLEKRVRPTGERHLHVENFYFVAPTALTGCPNPFALRFLRERFLGSRAANWQGPKRIYLTRARKTRGIVDEEAVESFFRERGWALIDSESLSLANQIALFADADAICGLHGGAFANLVWCPPGCKVLEIFAEGFLNGCYEGIALCLGLTYRWVSFPADGEFRARVELPQIETTLQEMHL